MMPSLPKPKRLPAQDSNALKAASSQLHFASQYLVAVGSSFLSSAADDSHTNLGWTWDRGFLSRPFVLDQTYQLVLNIPNFRLDLQVENGGVQQSWKLEGQPRTELYQHLRSFFAERQTPDNKNYQPIDHYKLPDPQLDTFEKPDLHLLETLMDYRHNAQVFLTEAAKERSTNLGVRIWPHHFDTAALFTLEQGAEGQAQKTIGIGMAIPDSLSNSHYYYINHWREAGEIDYSELPILPKGAYWHRGEDVMAMLPMSAVVACQSLEEQAQMVNAFFREGIPASRQLLQTATVAHRNPQF